MDGQRSVIFSAALTKCDTRRWDCLAPPTTTSSIIGGNKSRSKLSPTHPLILFHTRTEAVTVDPLEFLQLKHSLSFPIDSNVDAIMWAWVCVCECGDNIIINFNFKIIFCNTCECLDTIIWRCHRLKWIISSTSQPPPPPSPSPVTFCLRNFVACPIQIVVGGWLSGWLADKWSMNGLVGGWTDDGRIKSPRGVGWDGNPLSLHYLYIFIAHR